jgi:hypothetical protein
MATFHENLKQSFKNFKNKYIGNVPSGVTLAQINADLSNLFGSTTLIAEGTTSNITWNDIKDYRLIVLVALYDSYDIPYAMATTTMSPATIKLLSGAHIQARNNDNTISDMRYVSDNLIELRQSAGAGFKLFGVK